MSKVNSQTLISGKDLQLPELPELSESSGLQSKRPASDSLPKITHAKSKHGGENILKRSVDLLRKISIGKNRAHVSMELDKKIGTKPNEESSTGHIKTRTQKKVSFLKSGHNNLPAVKSERAPVSENKEKKGDELKVTFLTNGLIKVARDKSNDIGNNKKKELEIAVRQLFNGRGEELNEATLKELRGDASALLKIPEVKYLSITLKEKIDEALSKKAEAASKALVNTEKNTLGSFTPSAKAEILRGPQSKLSASDIKLIDEIAKSKDLDEITAALERMEVSSQNIPNKLTPDLPLSELMKAEKIAMPAPDGPILSAKTERLREPQSKPSSPDMALDEFMAALDKSNNIDEISTAVDRSLGDLSQNIPNRPTSAAPPSADDELEWALKELSDELKRT